MEFRFKDIRDEHDYKQIDIANEINMSRSAYANIEAEAANIKLRTLLLYCNKFDYSMDYVARLKPDNKTDNINKNITEINKRVLIDRLSIIESENKLRQVDVARLLGIQRSTYSEYKNPNSTNIIQTLMLKKIASDYGYSLDWLVGRCDKKTLK